MYGIPSYKLEKDVIEAEIEVLKELGVTIQCNVEVGKDITLDELRAQGYQAFYIAIGAQKGRMPNIPGEDAENTMTAVSFLKEVHENKISQLNGRVVVVGGGNVAIDAARVASRIGGQNISMFALEQEKELPASKEEIMEAKEEDIQIHCGWGPKEVVVEDGKVKGIIFKKCIRVFDENGRFAPVYDENEVWQMDCEYVIFSIGQCNDYGDLLKGSKVTFGRGNCINADALTYQSEESDIFVGGDVYSGPRFAIDAIAAGKEGAESLHRYVHWNASLTIGRNRRDFKELDKNNIVIESYDNGCRQEAGMDESIDYRHSFQDAHKTLSEEQVKKETARCLGCGASIVDPNKCIGCGICTTKCEFDAIHLHRDLPEHSKMVVSEEKMKHILPYAAKRGLKIMFKKKPTTRVK